jgi:uncharacterized protein (TIGR00296 family)
MDLESGKYLVKKAREAIESYLSGKGLPEVKGFEKKQGVFVTLETYPDKNLRGCIGFAEPIMPLNEAIIRAAVSAATQDPRFPPVNSSDLKKIVIQISVLTPPKKIVCPVGERPGEVAIGKDGLIAKCGSNTGLLLPQVPVDWEWDEKTFICQTCIKAGLPSDSWESENVELYKFQAEIFSEKTPAGKVEKKKL